jgi:hypothetical protein
MQIMDSRNEVRELNNNEIDLVNGGLDFGTGPGGIFSLRNVTRAVRFAGGLGLLYQSGQLGYDLGSWGYNTYTRYKYSSR